MITVEQQNSLRDDTETECVIWTRNYSWMPNELACGDDGNQYKCLSTDYCKYVDPTDADLKAKADAHAKTTVWENAGTAVEKEEFEEGEDCLTYTEGERFTFYTGDIVCAGALFECLDYLKCSETAPGTVGSESTWAVIEETGDLTLPRSEIKDDSEWEYSKTYNLGDFAEGEDGKVYKCISD